MKALKLGIFLFFLAWLVLPVFRAAVTRNSITTVHAQSGSVDCDPVPGACTPTEALTGFDDQSIDTVFVSDATHHDDQIAFDTVEGITDGLGPVYNAQSCRECHQNTVSGGASQVLELRAGFDDFGLFFNPSVKITDDSGNASFINNRSLINLRAICPAGPLNFTMVNGHPFDHRTANAQERADNAVDPFLHEPIPEEQLVTAFRLSLNTLGDGLVEAVSGNTLAAIAASQPSAQGGLYITVPVLENTANQAERVGRFGWKTQHASLLSFSSDAYLNEMGITNRLSPNRVDVTSVCDEVADIEDTANDIDTFARFMRATKAPPRAPGCETCPNPKTQIVHGSQLFDQLGCAVCHVRSITTAPAGTVINCGQFTVPAGLGCKTFHPFGDFLLHDIGTGDGIAQTLDTDGNLDQRTLTLMRTAPLWGLRVRALLMHDGKSVTLVDAIRRHRNQALSASNAFFALSDSDKNDVIAFLLSL